MVLEDLVLEHDVCLVVFATGFSRPQDEVQDYALVFLYFQQLLLECWPDFNHGWRPQFEHLVRYSKRSISSCCQLNFVNGFDVVDHRREVWFRDVRSVG